MMTAVGELPQTTDKTDETPRQSVKGPIMNPSVISRLETCDPWPKEPELPEGSVSVSPQAARWFFIGGFLGGIFCIVMMFLSKHENPPPSPIMCGLVWMIICTTVSILSFCEQFKHIRMRSALWCTMLLGIGIIIPFIPLQLLGLRF